MTSLRRPKVQSVSKMSEKSSQSLTRISAALASLDIVEDPLVVLVLVLVLVVLLVLLDLDVLILLRAFNCVSSLSALARDSRELRSFCDL